jgi:regulatory protein
LKKSYTVEQAKHLLERYCVYQDRCHNEVEKKLDSLNLINEAKEVIILHLLKNDFLNEERFARSFARGRFAIKKWGKLKIINALKWKNISDYCIKAALTEIDENEYAKTLQLLVDKKALVIREKNEFIMRKKLTNYLLSKGFEISLIINAINKTIENKKQIE